MICSLSVLLLLLSYHVILVRTFDGDKIGYYGECGSGKVLNILCMHYFSACALGVLVDLLALDIKKIENRRIPSYKMFIHLNSIAIYLS